MGKFIKPTQFIKILKTRIEPLMLERYPEIKEWEACRYEVYHTLLDLYILCSHLVPYDKLFSTMLRVITSSVVNKCNIPDALHHIWEKDNERSVIKSKPFTNDQCLYFIRKLLEIYYVEMVLDTASQNEKVNYIEALSELSKQVKALNKENNISEILPYKEDVRTENTHFVSQVFNFLSKSIVGQDEALKRISVAIYQFIYSNKIPNPLLLMIGPTGSGKTHLFDTVAAFAKQTGLFSCIAFDASVLTAAGFTGMGADDLSKEIRHEMLKCPDPSMAKVLVFLDEADKLLITKNYDSHNVDVNKITQQQLLRILEGRIDNDIKDNKVNVTGNVMFILSGVFKDLEIQGSSTKRVIGFGNTLSYDEGESKFNIMSIRDTLCKQGIERELMGRVTSIIKFSALGKKQLKEVANKEVSIIRKRLLREGIELCLEDSVLEVVVEKAMNENLGARSVKNVLYDLFCDWEFEALSEGYSKIELSSDNILQNTRPTMSK